MPYPSQTSADEIRSAALSLLTGSGEASVTVRGVAKTLNLTPNALYGYYNDRNALLAELATEGARQLLDRLEGATDGVEGPERVYALADAYVAFGLGQGALYALMMRPHRLTPGQEAAFSALWTFVKGSAGIVAPDTDVAAVSLWGFLHGMIGLEQAGVFHEGKPRTGVRPGLEALLAGFAG